jgi:phosphate starvation-inducible PhoH-like protein
MQNATPKQMLMMLTRIGLGSKLVLTGDPGQHDRGYEENGFSDFLKRLEASSGAHSIDHVQFSEADILRHPVIKEVLEVFSQDI